MAFTQKMFQKRWLIPVWVVQLIGLGIYFILACVGLSLTDNLDDSLEDYGYSSSDSDDISYVPSFHTKQKANLHKPSTLHALTNSSTETPTAQVTAS
jgi:hypothetical protein